ncbi:hypothetical protein [Sphingorhabdus sp.]|jgi:hypothetical protein
MTAIVNVYRQVAIVPTRKIRQRLKRNMRYPKPLWYQLLRFAFRNSGK